MNGKMVYICNFSEDLSPLDSAEIIHGTFRMSGNVDSTKMVVLFMDNRPLGIMVLEKGRISIDINNVDFKVSGTELNDKLYDFTSKKREYENLMNSLDSKLARRVMEGADYDEVKDSISVESGKLISEYDNHIKNFIISNYDNVLSVGVFLLMCYSTPSEALPDSFYLLYEKAPEAFRNNVTVKKYLSIVYPGKFD